MKHSATRVADRENLLPYKTQWLSYIFLFYTLVLISGPTDH